MLPKSILFYFIYLRVNMKSDYYFVVSKTA